MKIQGNTIIFKSTPENYYKELNGLKSNTVRRITQPEEVEAFWNFKKNRNSKSKICITTKFSSGDVAQFMRKITDITKFEGCESERAGIWIISWEA